MSPQNVNLQDSFLNQARKEAAPVEIMLLNGAQFNGIIRGFDSFTVVVHVEDKQHLVYKHSIAQIVAAKPKRSSHSNAGPKPKKPAHAGTGKREDKKPVEKKKAPAEKFNALDLSSIQLEAAAPADAPAASAPEPVVAASTPDTGSDAAPTAT